jgi:hypothetical protein
MFYLSWRSQRLLQFVRIVLCCFCMCSTATPSIVIAQESQVLDAVEKRTEMVSNVLQKIGILTIVIGIVVAGINLIFNRSNWIMVISLVIAGVVISQSGAIATMLME